jgi:hypothetical protein
MAHWRTRYVLLAFLMDSAAVLGMMLFFAVSLVCERYFRAFAGAMGIFVCALWWQLLGEELWFRLRLWRRMDTIL